jgi:hypothetical protein
MEKMYGITKGLFNVIDTICCKSSLGLMTKAKACKGVGQKWSLKITFHAPESVKKCEGMNRHTPKWIPTLGVGVSMNFEFS